MYLRYRFDLTCVKHSEQCLLVIFTQVFAVSYSLSSSAASASHSKCSMIIGCKYYYSHFVGKEIEVIEAELLA